MDSRQMTEWLNAMRDDGWEFVGYAQKWWASQSQPQDWWIFKRTIEGG